MLALREIGDLPFHKLGREGRMCGRCGGRGYVSHSPSHMRIGVEKVKREGGIGGYLHFIIIFSFLL